MGPFWPRVHGAAFWEVGEENEASFDLFGNIFLDLKTFFVEKECVEGNFSYSP